MTRRVVPKGQNFILNKIQSYNQKNKWHPIQFIHGSSSAVFSFLGKKVTVTNSQGQLVTKVIPHALIPSGILRKQYGVYPFSGEQEYGTFGLHTNSRREGINYNSISGMLPDKHGEHVTLRYATQYSAPLLDVDKIDQKIKENIFNLSSNNYLRSLKVLLMITTNLMLIDPKFGKEKSFCYHELLLNEYVALLKNSTIDLFELERKFNKYLKKIDSALSGESLPFSPDGQFLNGISVSFPVIFCSTKKGKPFTGGLMSEEIHVGELDLKHIPLLFTPIQHIDDLKKILKQHRLDHIEVREFYPEFKEDILEYKTHSTAIPEDFLSKTQEIKQATDLIPLIKKHQKEKYLSDFIKQKLNVSIQDYITSGNKESWKLATWITHNSPVLIARTETIEAIYTARELDNTRQILAKKTSVNPVYQVILDKYGLISNTQEQLERASYFVAIENFHESFTSTQQRLLSLFVYKDTIEKKALQNFINLKDRLTNTHMHISRFYDLYEILFHDLQQYPIDCQEYKNIRERIDFVKELYIEEIVSVIKKGSEKCDPLIQGRLFFLVKPEIMKKLDNNLPALSRLQVPFVEDEVSIFLHEIKKPDFCSENKEEIKEERTKIDAPLKKEFISLLENMLVNIKSLNANKENKFHIKAISQLIDMIKGGVGYSVKLSDIISHWKKSTCTDRLTCNNYTYIKETPLTDGNLFTIFKSIRAKDIKLLSLIKKYDVTEFSIATQSTIKR